MLLLFITLPITGLNVQLKFSVSQSVSRKTRK